MDQFDPGLIQMVLDKLTPDNMNVVVVSKRFEGKEGNLKEQWYGTEYGETKMDKELLHRFEMAMNRKEGHRFKIPGRNPFIPTKFDLLPELGEEEKATRGVIPSLAENVGRRMVFPLFNETSERLGRPFDRTFASSFGRCFGIGENQEGKLEEGKIVRATNRAVSLYSDAVFETPSP
ncbi:MAG: hypothetical protein GY820_21705, partial [Gammaproteobacteria bacterium]|nr:hypothetical protein [Gammaproteobacteria bacterium]